jgi:hypothetical protein
MDYYKNKYYKYKFKYYNLLNQSGGAGHADEEFFKRMNMSVNALGYLIYTDKDGKIKYVYDPLTKTKTPILKINAVIIKENIYDANSLFNYIKEAIKYTYNNGIENIPPIPNTREHFTIETLHDIYDKAKKDYNIDSEVIILFKQLILEKIVNNKQNFDKFERELRELKLIPTKEAKIIEAVKKDYRVLAYLDDRIITENIIKAVNSNETTLAVKFIPKEKRHLLKYPYYK